MGTIKFYDTCALLNMGERLFATDEPFAFCSVSLKELENIKTSKSKSDEVKQQARTLTRLLDEYWDKGRFLAIPEFPRDPTISPDEIICDCAHDLGRLLQDMDCPYECGFELPQGTQVLFVTDDLNRRLIASAIRQMNTMSTQVENIPEYKGFKEVTLSDEELAYFYEHMGENLYELLTNQYLIIRNGGGEVVDKLKWDGQTHKAIKRDKLKSQKLGVVKAYKDDVYQQLAIDSLLTNQLTMLKGPAGTGKSYLALGYLLSALEGGKLDQIVVFCNPVSTINSAKIGFLPGSLETKLLDSQIGNMLSSKLGDAYVVEQMLRSGKLVLLPMSDIRGYDTTGRRCGVYITEAQNTDVSLMKLALQRIGEESICVIDGDYHTQVDLNTYMGRNNGMRRMSEVFCGEDFYGEVELQKIYRSRIAETAERM